MHVPSPAGNSPRSASPSLAAAQTAHALRRLCDASQSSHHLSVSEKCKRLHKVICCSSFDDALPAPLGQGRSEGVAEAFCIDGRQMLAADEMPDCHPLQRLCCGKPDDAIDKKDVRGREGQ